MSKHSNDPLRKAATRMREEQQAERRMEAATAGGEIAYITDGMSDEALAKLYAAAMGEPEYDNVRQEVLYTADEHVNGDRNAQYGDPTQDFRRTADLWNVYLHGVAQRKLNEWGVSNIQQEIALDLISELIDTWDVAMMQVLIKASRSTVSPGKLDHWVDVAGYAACGGDCVDAGGILS